METNCCQINPSSSGHAAAWSYLQPTSLQTLATQVFSCMETWASQLVLQGLTQVSNSHPKVSLGKKNNEMVFV